LPVSREFNLGPAADWFGETGSATIHFIVIQAFEGSGRMARRGGGAYKLPASSPRVNPSCRLRAIRS
jgi:hypothetical protein